MSKHTPGPWDIAKGKTYCAIRTDERVIADMRLVGLHHNEANARLIAAAPELLDALQAALEALRGSAGFDEINNAKKQVKAAIAKATGEQA
jgi:hypothetical protein